MGMLCKKTVHHGFSLIELLIVISVFGILAIAAAPNMSAGVSEKDLNNAATTLVQSINRATKIAAAESTFVDITISNNIIVIEKLNTNATQTLTLPTKVEIESDLTIRFGSMGYVFTNPTSQTDNGTRVIEDIILTLVSTIDSSNKVISVSPIGRVAS